MTGEALPQPGDRVRCFDHIHRTQPDGEGIYQGEAGLGPGHIVLTGTPRLTYVYRRVEKIVEPRLEVNPDTELLVDPKTLVTRPGLAEWGIGIATAVATRADCSRRQVGAVVFDETHRVLSVGYNGAAPGQPGCASEGACPRGRSSYEEVRAMQDYTSGAGLCIAIHAEANALLYSDPDRRHGGWMAITCEPCPGCWNLLMGSGLRHVAWPGVTRSLPFNHLRRHP